MAQFPDIKTVIDRTGCVGYQDFDSQGNPTFESRVPASFDKNVSISGSLTVTGGNILYSFTVSKGGSELVDLEQLDTFMEPGEVLTIAAAANSGTSDIDVAATWIEER